MSIKPLLPVLLLVTGCTGYRSTPVEKTASMTRYETPDSGQTLIAASGRTIRLKPTGRLPVVTAWVLAGDELVDEKVRTLMAADTAGVASTASSPPRLGGVAAGMGGAVAITPDGYFLTAAHLVSFRYCWAAYVSAVHPFTYRFVKARRVFSNPTADLALIKIEMATPRYLELQDPPAEAAGAVVFSGHLGTQPSAGEILATQDRLFRSEGRQQPYQRLTIQIPIMPGDSGAPVIDQQGRLRGVITEEIYGLGWKLPHRAYATMPRKAFITELIEQDRSKSGRLNH
jgi:S1-C subfamily serine protease